MREGWIQHKQHGEQATTGIPQLITDNKNIYTHTHYQETKDTGGGTHCTPSSLNCY